LEKTKSLSYTFICLDWFRCSHHHHPSWVRPW